MEWFQIEKMVKHWPSDLTLTGTDTQVQNEPGSNYNEVVHCISQRSRTRGSPSDGLVSCQNTCRRQDLTSLQRCSRHIQLYRLNELSYLFESYVISLFSFEYGGLLLGVDCCEIISDCFWRIREFIRGKLSNKNAWSFSMYTGLMNLLVGRSRESITSKYTNYPIIDIHETPVV